MKTTKDVIVLDTNVLGEFLCQYYEQKIYESPENQFCINSHITDEIAHHLNHFLSQQLNNPGFNFVVIPILAVVELMRRFNKIVMSRIELYKLNAFLDNHPNWIIIEPLTIDPFYELVEFPSRVRIAPGHMRNLEWADVLIASAATSRDNAYLATSDSSLKKVEILKEILL